MTEIIHKKKKKNDIFGLNMTRCGTPS